MISCPRLNQGLRYKTCSTFVRSMAMKLYSENMPNTYYRQILNAQCPIRSLAHDDRTIKVKKLEQRLIATLSSN